MFWPNPIAGYQGFQPDIKVSCTPDIMSCYTWVFEVFNRSNKNISQFQKCKPAGRVFMLRAKIRNAGTGILFQKLYDFYSKQN